MHPLFFLIPPLFLHFCGGRVSKIRGVAFVEPENIVISRSGKSGTSHASHSFIRYKLSRWRNSLRGFNKICMHA